LDECATLPSDLVYHYIYRHSMQRSLIYDAKFSQSLR
jgi:hypothetical protein